MPDTAVVWFRRDLRVADLPALAHACREHERIVPLFVFDPQAAGADASARPAARRGCSSASRRSTASCARGERGWCVRHGRPETEVRRVAARGRRRDRARLRRRDRLRALARRPRGGGAGARRRRAAPPPGPLRGRPAADRHRPGRPVQGLHALPARLARPGAPARPSARRARSRWRRSRRASCRRCARWASKGARRACRTAPSRARPRPGAPPSAGCAAPRLERYAERRDVLAEPTSRLSAYLRFGCLSPLWLERARGRARRCSATATSSRGATSSPPCSCTSPRRARVELDARYRALEWDRDPALAARLARGRARAFPSSTPRCASSPPPAGCTTARG